jgi:hypothetical protein
LLLTTVLVIAILGFGSSPLSLAAKRCTQFEERSTKNKKWNYIKG